jgi:hypothetical protein
MSTISDLKALLPLADHLAILGFVFAIAANAYVTGYILGRRLGWRPIKTLVRLVDLVPPPRLRKRLQKMLADQAAHTTSLRRQGRYLGAYWIEVSTWGLTLWYIAVAPIGAAIAAARNRVGGTDE